MLMCSRMCVVAAALGVAVVTAVVTQPADATQVTNGSFETDFTGWSAVGNLGVALDANRASDGSRFAGFNSGNATPNGVLSQVINLNPGWVYELSFDFGKFSVCCIGGTAALDVTVTGVGTLLSETVSDSGFGTTAASIYETFVFGFVADSATATLSFTDVTIGGTNFDAYLDQVSVVAVAVPEPSTASLLALGLVALARGRANLHARAR